MKKTNIAIFLTVFFLIYGLINIYIHHNCTEALLVFGYDWPVILFNIIFTFLVFSYPIARIAGKWLPGNLADSLAFIGGLWFAAILYFSLAIVLLDLIMLIINSIPAFYSFFTKNILLFNGIAFGSVVVSTSILIIYGYFNASSPQVKNLHIPINKNAHGIKNLHIVFASDIHLGHIIGKTYLTKILTKINKLNPDLVLFPGDLVDEELKPVIDKNLGELFRSLNPKYVVFAVTGNHEYIGGAEQAVKYLSQFGITFLRDEVIKIDNSFYVAGREDISRLSFYGKQRKTITGLLSGANSGLPVIMMDHQPIALGEAAAAGVDLQISGHTHHGQMWPLQAITQLAFKLSWGYTKIADSHFYVSSGVGSWGPRVRIGNRPEIVSIQLLFQTKSENAS